MKMLYLYKPFPHTAETQLCLAVLLIRCFLEPSESNWPPAVSEAVSVPSVVSSCIEAA